MSRPIRWQPGSRQSGWIKAGLFLLCLVPLGRLFYGGFMNALGANPIETITRSTGWWTLFLLMATLSVTPLRRISGANWLLKLRRMLGLYAFFYASLHFSSYLFLDLGAFWSQLLTDIVKRPYITVGFSAWLLLVPLALTSTNAMMRRLGRHWQRLHRLSYLIALLGVLHFVWLVKADLREPLLYAALFAVLMLARWRPRRLNDRS